MKQKSCFKCERVLPLSEFYKHPGMSDGHLGKCKDCTKRDVRDRYQVTREARSAYERERYKRPERRAAVAESLKHRDPVKRRAQQMTSYAIRSGRLVRQPCETCGAKEYIQAHHDDYSKPLEVRWLCFRCHRAHHGQTTTSVPTRGRHVVK